MAAGLGVLARPERSTGLWARVAGDGIDLGVMARSLRDNPRRARLLGAIALVVGITVLDAVYASRLSR